MTKLKKLAIACATGALLAGAITAPGMARAAKKISIGFTVYGMSGWVSSGYQGVKKVAKADNVDLHWASADFQVAKQAAQMRDFINQHVDAIVIDPVDSAALAPQIKKAEEAGIKVIGTNVKIFPPGNQYLTSYVGPDDVLAGRREAEALIKALNGHGNVVILEGPLGQSATIDRTKGNNEALKEASGIKVLARQPGEWSRTKAYHIMSSWLSKYGSKIDGVISQNDDMAEGAIRAMKQRGMNNIPIVGIDGIKAGLKNVKSGRQLMTNLQNAPLQLGEALQVAVDAVQGKSVPKTIFIHMPVVTKANAQHFLDQMYTNRKAFLANLPSLVKTNLANKTYGKQ